MKRKPFERLTFIPWYLIQTIILRKKINLDRLYSNGYCSNFQYKILRKRGLTMAEKEYIEKGALLKHFDDVINNKFGDADFKKAAWGFSIYVDKMPAADVAPVKHGHWEYKKNIGDMWDYHFICSECKGNTPNRAYTIAPDYCPNCGAKMDGGEQE